MQPPPPPPPPDAYYYAEGGGYPPQQQAGAQGFAQQQQFYPPQGGYPTEQQPLYGGAQQQQYFYPQQQQQQQQQYMGGGYDGGYYGGGYMGYPPPPPQQQQQQQQPPAPDPYQYNQQQHMQAMQANQGQYFMGAAPYHPGGAFYPQQPQPPPGPPPPSQDHYHMHSAATPPQPPPPPVPGPGGSQSYHIAPQQPPPPPSSGGGRMMGQHQHQHHSHARASPQPGMMGSQAAKGIALPAPIQKVVDARDIFLEPGRATRPERICIILRGIPGSGKSHVAKMIRDVEKEHGGSCRVHCLDDYFLTEVTKQEKDENGVTQSVVSMEYIYEAEMEPVYMASHLKAFQKTLQDPLWKVVVADSINVRRGHFEDFWKAAKAKGFEVYVAELGNDIKKCVARNVHGWGQQSLERMVEDWDKTPDHMSLLSLKHLLGDKAIEDVDMEDEEDGQVGVTSEGDDGGGDQTASSRGGGGGGPSPRSIGGGGDAVRGSPDEAGNSEAVPSSPREYDGGAGGGSVSRKRPLESPGPESGGNKSRWDDSDDDDDANGSDQENSRAASRLKSDDAATTKKQPVGAKDDDDGTGDEEKRVRWREPLDELAIFDEMDGVGFIRRGAAAQGGFELSAVAMLRKQERRKTLESSKETRNLFLKKMHEEQRSFKDLFKKLNERALLEEDGAAAKASAPPPPPPPPPAVPVVSSKPSSRWS